MKIIVLKHPQSHIVKGADLENIYISPVLPGRRICPMCARSGAEVSVPMWDVSIGNSMRGFFYRLSDAQGFAEWLMKEEGKA